MAVRGAIFEFKHIAGHQEDAALAFESRQPRTRRVASSRRLP
jgi:hypothetical protein